MEHDGNDVDAAFEALIAREFGEVVTAPGRPRPNGLPACLLYTSDAADEMD